MTFIDDLIAYSPFAPFPLLAAGVIYWLRASRLTWIAAGLIAVCIPGIILTWYLRGVGFDAYGGVCTPDKARGFMEAMQYVFLAQIIAGIAGSTMLGVIAVRRNLGAGGMLALLLATASIVTGFMIYFAAGMTAVDGYRC